LSVSEDVLGEAMTQVVKTEAPVHKDDLISRVAVALGHQKATPRIAARLGDAVSSGHDAGRWIVRGDFVYHDRAPVRVRNREGTGIPGERIPPEEYRLAVRHALASGGPLPRDAIVKKVVAILGYSRTGSQLQQGVGRAIDTLLQNNEIGQGSAGLALRR